MEMKKYSVGIVIDKLDMPEKIEALMIQEDDGTHYRVGDVQEIMAHKDLKIKMLHEALTTLVLKIPTEYRHLFNFRSKKVRMLQKISKVEVKEIKLPPTPTQAEGTAKQQRAIEREKKINRILWDNIKEQHRWRLEAEGELCSNEIDESWSLTKAVIEREIING